MDVKSEPLSDAEQQGIEKLSSALRLQAQQETREAQEDFETASVQLEKAVTVRTVECIHAVEDVEQQKKSHLKGDPMEKVLESAAQKLLRTAKDATGLVAALRGSGKTGVAASITEYDGRARKFFHLAGDYFEEAAMVNDKAGEFGEAIELYRAAEKCFAASQDEPARKRAEEHRLKSEKKLSKFNQVKAQLGTP